MNFSLEDFELLKKTTLFDADDIKYLRMSYDILKDQTDAVLDVWYGFVGSQPHLLRYFSNKKIGSPIPEYLNAVRIRFAQWILDTSKAQYDQKWLNYQFEIGRRHHRSAKNKTDNVDSVDLINFRYLIPLIFPIIHTLKPFLGKKGARAEDVERMQQAWLKSVLMQITLWSQAYVKPEDY